MLNKTNIYRALHTPRSFDCPHIITWSEFITDRVAMFFEPPDDLKSVIKCYTLEKCLSFILGYVRHYKVATGSFIGYIWNIETLPTLFIKCIKPSISIKSLYPAVHIKMYADVLLTSSWYSTFFRCNGVEKLKNTYHFVLWYFISSGKISISHGNSLESFLIVSRHFELNCSLINSFLGYVPIQQALQVHQSPNYIH